MKIGTCDCCNTPDVELSRSEIAGLETWSCTDGCPSPDQLAVMARKPCPHDPAVNYVGCQCDICAIAGFRQKPNFIRMPRR